MKRAGRPKINTSRFFHAASMHTFSMDWLAGKYSLESPMFLGKIDGFRWRFSRQQTNPRWHVHGISMASFTFDKFGTLKFIPNLWVETSWLENPHRFLDLCILRSISGWWSHGIHPPWDSWDYSLPPFLLNTTWKELWFFVGNFHIIETIFGVEY